MIDAATALEFGLVNRVVARSTLRESVNEMARIIAAKPPASIRLGKRAVRKQAGMNLADAYDCASRAMVENVMAVEAETGIRTFIEKRKHPRN